MKRSKKWIGILMAGILAVTPLTVLAIDSGDGSQPDVSQVLAEVQETATPDTVTPDVTTPEATTPAVPDATTPASTPEATTPEATTPETAAPEATTPEATTPETAAPEATTPEATTPETAAPEATTPEATTPAATPGTTTPEATTPEATPEAANGATAEDTALDEKCCPEEVDQTALVQFKLIGSFIKIGDITEQICEFDKQNPEKAYTFTASDFTDRVPSGYYIVNPDEQFTLSYVLNEEGVYELTPYEIHISVQKTMPDPVPTLKVEYRFYNCSSSILNMNMHYGDYKVVYQDTVDGWNMDLKSYAGNKSEVGRLGYEIVNDLLYPSEKVISLNCFDGQSSLPDGSTPWIPGDFLSWTYVKEIGQAFLKDGAIPFPVVDNTVIFVVEPAAGDNVVSVGFQTQDKKRVGNTTNMEVDKYTGELALSKDNVVLPTGYELVDPNEAYTVHYGFDGEKWTVDTKEVLFTVKKIPKDPLIPDRPTPGGDPVVPPKYDTTDTTKTIVKTVETTTVKAVKTGDTTNASGYIVLLVSALGLVVVGLTLKKRAR